MVNAPLLAKGCKFLTAVLRARFLVSHFLLILRWLMTAADIVDFNFLTMVYLL